VEKPVDKVDKPPPARLLPGQAEEHGVPPRHALRTLRLLETGLSRSSLCLASHLAMAVAGGDDALGAMHGSAGQPGYPGPVCPLSGPGRTRAAPPAVVEALIRSTGFFRNKAANLVACARALGVHHGGEVRA